MADRVTVLTGTGCGVGRAVPERPDQGGLSLVQGYQLDRQRIPASECSLLVAAKVPSVANVGRLIGAAVSDLGRIATMVTLPVDNSGLAPGNHTLAVNLCSAPLYISKPPSSRNKHSSINDGEAMP